eukprot:gene28786-35707_t
MVNVSDAEYIVRQNNVYFRDIKLRLEYSHMQARPDVCYSWKFGGKCDRGDECRYKHESTEVCPAFKTTGLCDNKQGNCILSHDKKLLTFCLDLKLYGKCSFGSQCKYSHVLGESMSSKIEGEEEGELREEDTLCTPCEKQTSAIQATGECHENVSVVSAVSGDVNHIEEVGFGDEHVALDARGAPYQEVAYQEIPHSVVTPQTVPHKPSASEDKICPTLLSTGKCDQHACPFSHDTKLLTFCAQWKHHGTCQYRSNCKFPHPPYAGNALPSNNPAPTHTHATARLTSEAVAALNNEKEATRRAVETERNAARSRITNDAKSVVSVDSVYSCSSTERYCWRRRIRHRSLEYYKEKLDERGAW